MMSDDVCTWGAMICGRMLISRNCQVQLRGGCAQKRYLRAHSAPWKTHEKHTMIPWYMWKTPLGPRSQFPNAFNCFDELCVATVWSRSACTLHCRCSLVMLWCARVGPSHPHFRIDTNASWNRKGAAQGQKVPARVSFLNLCFFSTCQWKKWCYFVSVSWLMTPDLFFFF